LDLSRLTGMKNRSETRQKFATSARSEFFSNVCFLGTYVTAGAKRKLFDASMSADGHFRLSQLVPPAI
jgi:hypothetical protein